MKKSWFFDPLKPGKYVKAIADPATLFKSHTPFETTKGAQYPVMSDAWLRALPVRHLAAADCLMMMWSTMPKLDFSISLLGEWGFRYVTAGAWHKVHASGKTAFGTGFVLQSAAEVFLIGAIGTPLYVNRPAPGVIVTEETHDEELIRLTAGAEGFDAVRREHSRKPDEQYAIMDQLMGDVPGCELFARQQWPGYDAWGNQADHFTPAGGQP